MYIKKLAKSETQSLFLNINYLVLDIVKLIENSLYSV